jgi:murein DD-endopeptidase MepM/ murein hydrolase activator NlpD
MQDQDHDIYEPPVDPLEDTHPTMTMRAVDGGSEAGWRRALGLLSLLGAFGFTLATVAVLMLGGGTDDPATPEPSPQDVAQATLTPTPSPTLDTAAPTNTVPTAQTVAGALPTLNPDTAAALLLTPIAPLIDDETTQFQRSAYQPFTVIPDRPRDTIIVHVAVAGDTINGLAETYGILPESIAWCNDRRIVQVLSRGDRVNIPPSDGVCIRAVGNTRSIADYASQYGIEDPFVVLDSPANATSLIGLDPTSVPPPGTPIFVPGGEGEEIVWTANIEVTGGDGAGGAATPSRVTFENNQPGSCAPQDIVGGSYWSPPLAPGTYTITRGFTPVAHPGIDLAGAIGTEVHAANGGRVIFAGWNSFGYGNMVAIIHGPFMTVYGHLSAWYVNCGQDVVAGQAIGAMGSSGNSTGPHLHFEIRSRVGNTYVAGDPSFTIGF